MSKVSRIVSRNSGSRGPQRQRRLRVENLESRTLLSASPWSGNEAAPQVPAHEPIKDAGGMLESLAEFAADYYRSTGNLPIDPIALSGKLQEVVYQSSQPDLHLSDAAISVVSGPHYAVDAPSYVGVATAMELDRVAPRSEGSGAMSHTSPAIPSVAEAMSVPMAKQEWTDSLASRAIDAYEPLDVVPPPMDSLAQQMIATVPYEGGRGEFSTQFGLYGDPMWGGERSPGPPADMATAMDVMRERIAPFMEEHSPYAEREPAASLAGISLLGGLIATSTESGESGSYDSESPINSLSAYELSLGLEEGGLISFSTYGSAVSPSTVSESLYETIWSGSTGSESLTGIQTQKSVSEADGTQLGFPSLGEASPLNVDEAADGGLIDISGSVFLRADEGDWGETSRYDRESAEEEPSEEEAECPDAQAIVAAALVDAVMKSQSEEGGMVELVAVASVASSRQAAGWKPLEFHGTGDIQMDAALVQFQAFEVASAPASLIEGPLEDSKPVQKTASVDGQEDATPEASASAATETRSASETQASAPAVIMGLLLTGVKRTGPESPSSERSRKKVRR